MKKLYKYLLAVATVAMAFTSCSKDEFSNPSTETQKVTFTVTSGSDLETPPASRTEFDEETGQMNWSADGEALEVIQILDTINAHATTEAYTIENRVAKFQVSFKALTGSEPYDLTYSAIYPAVNYSGNTNDYTKFRIKLPAEQTPTETGFDPNADLLLAKPETRTAQPVEGEELNFRFKRVAAIAKMTLKDIPAGEKLAKVELTASQPMAGYSRTNLKTGEIYDIGYYKEETMTLTLNDRETTGEDVIWFTSLPCVFGEGDSFTVKAYTDKATYEKTVSFSTPEAFKFVSGGLTRFGITGMTRTENAVDEYVLLTDVADLSVGDQIIITNGTDGAARALGPQSGNFRDEVAIEIASNTITTIPTGVQIITIETGIGANTFALNVGDGYLYAAGGTKDNYLKTQPSIDGNASWSILIESGAAIIKAQVQGEKPRNWLRYNKTSPRFSCYSSGQEDVYIFHKAGTPKTALETPTGLATEVDGNMVLVGWKPVAGATSYTVSFEPATIEPRTVLHDDAKAEYSELFEGLDYATEYTVSVVANPADTENYKASAPATATFTTGENPNVTYTQIKDLVDGGTYNVKDAMVVATSTNGPVLQDETGVIFAYLPSETPAVGSIVTISGTIESYGKALQFKRGATIEITGTGEVPALTATEVTATNIGEMMTAATVTPAYVKFTGTMKISKGKYYNVTFPFESSYQGSIYYPDAEAFGLAVLDGREINVEGWFINVSYEDNPLYLNVVATKVSSASEAPYITADETASFVAAGETKTISFLTDNLGSNQVFAEISGDGAGQFSVGQIRAESIPVTAVENTETTAKTATLTLYIAASEGGEHLAEAIVELTQAGVSSGESITYTETFSDFTETNNQYKGNGSYSSTEIAGLSWIYANCSLNQNDSKFVLGKNNANSSLMTSNITDGVSEITINWNAPYTSDKLRMLVYVNDNLVGTLDITATSGDSGQETISGINVSGNAVIKITGAAKVGSKDNRPGITGISWKNNN